MPQRNPNSYPHTTQTVRRSAKDTSKRQLEYTYNALFKRHAGVEDGCKDCFRNVLWQWRSSGICLCYSVTNDLGIAGRDIDRRQVRLEAGSFANVSSAIAESAIIAEKTLEIIKEGIRHGIWKGQLAS